MGSIPLKSMNDYLLIFSIIFQRDRAAVSEISVFHQKKKLNYIINKVFGIFLISKQDIKNL